MKTRPITVHVPVPTWPTRANLWRFTKGLLPTPGNVILTCALVAILAMANRAGALTLFAPNAPSTQVMPYQGRLAAAGGLPLTGNYAMTFALYDVSTSGVPLWTETWTGPNSVTVRDGLFNVALGSLTAIPQSAIAGRANVWLGITVGSDTEMSPRVQLGSVPFAVQALTVPDGSISQSKFAPEVSLTPPDGSLTFAKFANSAADPNRLQTWTNDAAQTLATACCSNTYDVDPGITITVPAGKVFYFQVGYYGSLSYSFVDRSPGNTSFYASWKAQIVNTGGTLAADAWLVQTGYRQDWSLTAANAYWGQPYSASWVIRLEQGVHAIKVRVSGYSDTSMTKAYLNNQRISVFRLL